MIKNLVIYAPFSIFLGLAACSETRRDPCELLTAEEVKSVDNTVTVSLWAGRDGERKDDEVCVFYTDDGDARAMLFVWYDDEKQPLELVSESTPGAEIIELPGVGLDAAAAYGDNEVKLLAVKSATGVVGLRVRKPVRKNSAEFNAIARLAETALSRK